MFNQKRSISYNAQILGTISAILTLLLSLIYWNCFYYHLHFPSHDPLINFFFFFFIIVNNSYFHCFYDHCFNWILFFCYKNFKCFFVCLFHLWWFYFVVISQNSLFKLIQLCETCWWSSCLYSEFTTISMAVDFV